MYVIGQVDGVTKCDKCPGIVLPTIKNYLAKMAKNAEMLPCPVCARSKLEELAIGEFPSCAGSKCCTASSVQANSPNGSCCSCCGGGCCGGKCSINLYDGSGAKDDDTAALLEAEANAVMLKTQNENPGNNGVPTAQTAQQQIAPAFRPTESGGATTPPPMVIDPETGEKVLAEEPPPPQPIVETNVWMNPDNSTPNFDATVHVPSLMPDILNSSLGAQQQQQRMSAEEFKRNFCDQRVYPECQFCQYAAQIKMMSEVDLFAILGNIKICLDTLSAGQVEWAEQMFNCPGQLAAMLGQNLGPLGSIVGHTAAAAIIGLTAAHGALNAYGRVHAFLGHGDFRDEFKHTCGAAIRSGGCRSNGRGGSRTRGGKPGYRDLISGVLEGLGIPASEIFCDHMKPPPPPGGSAGRPLCSNRGHGGDRSGVDLSGGNHGLIPGGSSATSPNRAGSAGGAGINNDLPGNDFQQSLINGGPAREAEAASGNINTSNPDNNYYKGGRQPSDVNRSLEGGTMHVPSHEAQQKANSVVPATEGLQSQAERMVDVPVNSKDLGPNGSSDIPDEGGGEAPVEYVPIDLTAGNLDSTDNTADEGTATPEEEGDEGAGIPTGPVVTADGPKYYARRVYEPTGDTLVQPGVTYFTINDEGVPVQITGLNPGEPVPAGAYIQLAPNAKPTKSTNDTVDWYEPLDAPVGTSLQALQAVAGQIYAGVQSDNGLPVTKPLIFDDGKIFGTTVPSSIDTLLNEVVTTSTLVTKTGVPAAEMAELYGIGLSLYDLQVAYMLDAEQNGSTPPRDVKAVRIPTILDTFPEW